MRRAFLLLGLLGFDQLSKWWFTRLGLVVMNQGGVFGWLPSRWWVGVLSLVLSFISYQFFLSITKENRLKNGLSLKQWAYGLIVIGGLSNLIDRIIYGAVRDFIYYPVINIYGNVADIVLVVGVGMMVFQNSDRKSG